MCFHHLEMYEEKFEEKEEEQQQQQQRYANQHRKKGLIFLKDK